MVLGKGVCIAAGAGIALAALCRRPMCVANTERAISRNVPLKSSHGQISVVSYNLLTQRFCTSQHLPHTFPFYLEWSYRWPLLKEELRNFGSDIIALQEVTVEK
jgi:mRNA deadenylase 3'-5' endonuclease subunit Ccr4